MAVIASRLAAEVYGLEIVDERIEDMPNNYTRFFVVGKGEPPRRAACKTSLVFAVPNTPGSLYHALGEFATPQGQPDQAGEPAAAQPTLAVCLLCRF